MWLWLADGLKGPVGEDILFVYEGCLSEFKVGLV